MHDCTLTVVFELLALSEMVRGFGTRNNICSCTLLLCKYRAKSIARESCNHFVARQMPACWVVMKAAKNFWLKYLRHDDLLLNAPVIVNRAHKHLIV